MPLAGKVRLSTFLLTAVVGVGAVGGGIAGWMGYRASIYEPPPAPDPVPAPAPVRPVAAPDPTPATSTLRDQVDSAVLAFQGQDLGSAKRKDVTSGQPFKVNVYQDDGHATANRAKVDLDRDDTWDEKFTFSDGPVQRQVSTADDETYDELWLLGPSGWFREGEEPPPPGEPAPAAPSDPVTAVVFGYQGQDLGTAKRKDVTQGKPFKVNVYQDDGHTTANRAKVDLDRDDQWDEKITFEADGSVSKKVSPQDDEDYAETYRWSGEAWVLE